MKDVDFPILIEGLINQGLTLVDIENETGINRTFLGNIKNELEEAPKQWQQVPKLLDLHFRYNPSKYIPLYGNHNEP